MFSCRVSQVCAILPLSWLKPRRINKTETAALAENIEPPSRVGATPREALERRTVVREVEGNDEWKCAGELEKITQLISREATLAGSRTLC